MTVARAFPFMAGAAVISVASAAAETSAYTALDLDACENLGTSGYEEPLLLRCPGYRDLSVFVLAGYDTYDLDPVRSDEAFDAPRQSNSLGDTIEWRLDDEGEPFAVIYRYYLYEADGPRRSELWVKSLGRGDRAGCLVATVPGSADANERAREVADRDARGAVCAEGEQGAAVGDAPSPPPLILQGGGLYAGGQSFGFGTPFGRALAHVGATLSKPITRAVSLAECGAGPMEAVEFAGGLTLNAQDDLFVGWVTQARDGAAPLPSERGLRIGTRRADLEASGTLEIYESTIGWEFTAGDGLFGLLASAAPDAEIETLWAGTTCFFR